MPHVDLNRIYHIRSRERQPVLNSVNVPDAAGAYLRAVRPAQQAQLGIARANAELDNDKWRRRVQGIQTGINAFQDTYNALERARERQEADELRKAQNQTRLYRLGHINDAMGRKYNSVKDEKGMAKIDGPLVAVREMWNAWTDERDGEGGKLRAGMSKRTREAYDEWLAAYRAEDELRADAAQRDAQQKDRAATYRATGATMDADIESLSDLDDLGNWQRKVQDRIDFTIGLHQWARGLAEEGADGKFSAGSITDADAASYSAMRRELWDGYNKKRLAHLANVYAETGDPEILDHLQAWGMSADEYAAQNKVQTDFHPEKHIDEETGEQVNTELRSDAGRQFVRGLRDDAIAKRERRMDVADKERSAAAATSFNAALEAARDALGRDDIGSVNNAWSIIQSAVVQAENDAGSIQDETRRANFLADVRKSMESARAAYGSDLLLRVGLGNLDANQQEVARADTAALYEDAPEGMRLKALDEMDLAIATKQGNAFAREFVAAQNAGEEGRVSEMLQEFKDMPDGKKKDLVGKLLFGGTLRGGTAGIAPPKKFTDKDVAFLLSNGENPAEVLKQIDHAYWDRALNAEGYLGSIALVQERMTFANSVGDKVPEYTKAVTDAMNAWLGVKWDYDKHQTLDANGNPAWISTDGKTYNTNITDRGRRVSWVDSMNLAFGNIYSYPDTLSVSDETLASAFKYGLQYVIRRANGLVEGKKDTAMTPEAVTQELQAEFDEFLTRDEAIANDILRNRIERARMRRMPWSERRIAGARQMAIAERSYH